jgi:hypothetical protein
MEVVQQKLFSAFADTAVAVATRGFSKCQQYEVKPPPARHGAGRSKFKRDTQGILAMAVADSTVFLGGMASLCAYDVASGKLRWQEDVPGKVDRWTFCLAAARGLVMSGCDDGTLSAFRFGGDMVWQCKKHQGVIMRLSLAEISADTSENGMQLLSAGHDGTIRAWNPASGESLWRFREAFDPFSNLAVVWNRNELQAGAKAEGGVVIGIRSNGNLAACKLADGARLWSIETESASAPISCTLALCVPPDSAGSSTISGTIDWRIVTADAAGAVRCIDPNPGTSVGGKIIWQAQEGGGVTALAANVVGVCSGSGCSSCATSSGPSKQLCSLLIIGLKSGLVRGRRLGGNGGSELIWEFKPVQSAKAAPAVKSVCVLTPFVEDGGDASGVLAVVSTDGGLRLWGHVLDMRAGGVEMGGGGSQSSHAAGAVAFLLEEFLVGGRKKRKRLLKEAREEELRKEREQEAKEQAVLLQALIAQSRSGTTSLTKSRRGGPNSAPIMGGDGDEPRWKRVARRNLKVRLQTSSTLQGIMAEERGVGAAEVAAGDGGSGSSSSIESMASSSMDAVYSTKQKKGGEKDLSISAVMKSMQNGHRPKWRLAAQAENERERTAKAKAKQRQKKGFGGDSEWDLSLAEEEERIRESVDEDAGLSSSSSSFSSSSSAGSPDKSEARIMREFEFKTQCSEVRTVLEQQERSKARKKAVDEMMRLETITAKERRKTQQIQEMERRVEEHEAERKVERKERRRRKRQERKAKEKEAIREEERKGGQQAEESDGSGDASSLSESAGSRDGNMGRGDGRVDGRIAKGAATGGKRVLAEGAGDTGGKGLSVMDRQRVARGQAKLGKSEAKQFEERIAQLEYEKYGEQSRFYQLQLARKKVMRAKRAADRAKDGELRRQQMVTRRLQERQRVLDGQEVDVQSEGGDSSDSEWSDESEDGDESDETSSSDDEEGDEERDEERRAVGQNAANGQELFSSAQGAAAVVVVDNDSAKSFSLLEARAARVRQLREQAKAKAAGMFDSMVSGGTEWLVKHQRRGPAFVTREDHMRLFVQAGLVGHNDDDADVQAVGAQFDATDVDGAGRLTREQFVSAQVPSVMKVLLELEEREEMQRTKKLKRQKKQQKQQKREAERQASGSESEGSGAYGMPSLDGRIAMLQARCEGKDGKAVARLYERKAEDYTSDDEFETNKGAAIRHKGSAHPHPGSGYRAVAPPRARARKGPVARMEPAGADAAVANASANKSQLMAEIAAANKMLEYGKDGAAEAMELAVARAAAKQQAVMVRQRLQQKKAQEEQKEDEDEAAKRRLFEADLEATRAKLELIKCEHAVYPTGTRRLIVGEMSEMEELMNAAQEEDRAKLKKRKKSKMEKLRAVREVERQSLEREQEAARRAQRRGEKYGRSVAHRGKKEGLDGGVQILLERTQAKQAMRREKNSKQGKKKRRQKLEQEKYERERRERAEVQEKKQRQKQEREFRQAMDAADGAKAGSSKGGGGKGRGTEGARATKTKKVKQARELKLEKPAKEKKTRFPRLVRF